MTWASIAAPEGFVYDVQIQKPGKDWADWRSGVVGRKTSFTPNAGKGKYRFHAQDAIARRRRGLLVGRSRHQGRLTA